MANEEITTPKPPWGGESGSKGGGSNTNSEVNTRRHTHKKKTNCTKV